MRSPILSFVGRSVAVGDLAVGVSDGDLVAEEFRRAGSGVGEEGLVRGQFQLEIVTQERRQALGDLLGLGLGPGEPE